MINIINEPIFFFFNVSGVDECLQLSLCDVLSRYSYIIILYKYLKIIYYSLGDF